MVDKWIDQVVLAMLNSMMVEPNGFVVNLEETPTPVEGMWQRAVPNINGQLCFVMSFLC